MTTIKIPELKDIKAIAFDWSGTISDDLRAVHLAVTMVLGQFGIGVESDPIAWGRQSGGSARADIDERRAKAEASGNRALAERLSELNSGNVYSDLYAAALRLVIHEGRSVPKPIGNIVEWLFKLRKKVGPGFPLVIISAHPFDMLDEDLGWYGLGGHAMVGSDYQVDTDLFDYVFAGRTNKAITLKEFADQYVLNFNSIAYVGDTCGDMLAAKAAGAVSVAVTSGYHTRERLVETHPDLIFENTADFIKQFVDQLPDYIPPYESDDDDEGPPALESCYPIVLGHSQEHHYVVPMPNYIDIPIPRPTPHHIVVTATSLGSTLKTTPMPLYPV